MKISARNQLKGTIANVTEGAVNGVVAISLGDATIKANITMEAVEQLGLAEGKEACAIIKASNVMFAVGDEPLKNISARNQLPGTITSIKKGAVNGHVVRRAGRRQQDYRLHHQRGNRAARPRRRRKSPRHYQVNRRDRWRGVTSVPVVARFRSAQTAG